MKYWRIEVATWGTLYAIGTEEQAETWRAAKANWERSIAKKFEIKKNDLPNGEKFERLNKLNC